MPCANDAEKKTCKNMYGSVIFVKKKYNRRQTETDVFQQFFDWNSD